MFKKSVQFFMILCLSLSMLNADEIQYNLLKNSSFEAGSSGWDSLGNAVTISKSSHSGQKALEFTTGGVAQDSALLPNIDKIDGNKKYIFSGYYKHTAAVEGMWVGVVYFNSNWDTIGEIDREIPKSTSYQNFNIEFSPPSGTNYMSIWLWSDGGSTLVDEVKLYPKTFIKPTCKLVQNGDFEKNLDGWSLYSSQTLSVNDAYKGTKAIQLYDGGMDQVIPLFGNKIDTYQFSGYYKSVGTPNGTWAGLDFYDKDDTLLFSSEVTLENTSDYKRFIINATTQTPAAYVQAWIWSEAKKQKGKIILDDLELITAECNDGYVMPSSLPPHGMSVERSPLFVVIGFDDNTKSEGIDWAIDMFGSKHNPDQSKITASFYMNTYGLDVEDEDSPVNLLEAMKRLKDSSHEVGNHTYDHQKGLDEAQIRNLDYTMWRKEIVDCEVRLRDNVGVLQNNLLGFRAPYLLYNNNTLKVEKERNYLYDCSIEEGYASQFNGTNFRWPYQLNEGSPGHNEGWNGNVENPDYLSLNPVEDLWELPVYTLMVPKDSECEKYGIKQGLWTRIVQALPYLEDYKITGFDYNLWHSAKLNKVEVLGILKYNLDLRLQGNRAPLTFGAHTQYYTDEWADSNVPNASKIQMRAAISEFLDYALSKPEVRVKSASDVIKWCQNPVALP